MSSDPIDTNNNTPIVEFDLTEQTKQDQLISRMYRQGNLIFVIIRNKFKLFIEVKIGKLSDVAQKFRELTKRELSIHKDDISQEDLMIIIRDISGEIPNNIEKLNDLASKEIKVEKSDKKKIFTVEDVWNENGDIDERKLTPERIKRLHNTKGILHANKVTKTRLSEKDQLFDKILKLKSYSLDERYKIYEDIDKLRTKSRDKILYESFVFRTSNVDGIESENNDDKVTNKAVEDSIDPSNATSPKSVKGEIFLEDAEHYTTKFVYFDATAKEFKSADYVIKEGRIILPTPTSGTPTIPYEFYNLEHLNEFYTREVKNKVSIASLFEANLQIFAHFNRQPKSILVSRAAAATISYFVDLYATVAYLARMGQSNSGKSTELFTLLWLVYRGLSMTNPNAAQAIRLFGNVEAAQYSLFIDEADKLDVDSDIIAMVKDGYSILGIWQKVNDNTKELDFFFTYCLKFWSAEKTPNEWRTMGFYSRTFLNLTSIQKLLSTDPNIKNLSVSGNITEEDQAWKLFMLKIRKQALLYRMVHYNDEWPNLDINVTGRDRELVYQYIQLFYDTPYQDLIIETMQDMLNNMNSGMKVGLSADICTRLAHLLIQKRTDIIRLNNIWDDLRNDEDFGIYMQDSTGKEKWIESYLHGKVTLRQISVEFRNNISATIEHTRNGNRWKIDLDSLINKLTTFLYDSNRIIVKLKEKREGCEPCEPSFEGTKKILNLYDKLKEETEESLMKKLTELSRLLDKLDIDKVPKAKPKPRQPDEGLEMEQEVKN